jgi:proteasome lid subunit RPN8/RPN11
MASPHIRESETGEAFEQGTWSVAGHPFVIHYAPDLLRRLAADSVEGFAKIPRGGIEVGGVLYGNRIGNSEITIIEARPLECEYKFGPSFLLSPLDEEHLGELIRACSSDPALAGLEPVGWFHAHTRSEIYLSEEDCQLHEKFFPEPWQIALVFRPEPLKPTRGGFFFREPGGSMRITSSYREFEVASQRRVFDTAPEEPEAGMGVSAPVEESAPVQQIARPAIPGTQEIEAPRSWRAAWLLAVLGLIAALVGFLLLRPRAPGGNEVALRMTAAKGVVFLEWNPRSPAVSQSVGGQLEVEDGENPRLNISLRPEDLRAGRVSFVPHSSQLHARLRLFDPHQSPQDFVANFIGPEIPAPAPAVSTQSAPVETGSDQPLYSTPLPPSEPEVRSRDVEPLQTPLPDTKKPAPRPFNAPSRPKPAIKAPELAAPPSIAITPTLPAGAPLAAPVTAAPPPPPKPAKPAVRAPASGRAIWAGELKAGETLVFEDGRVSKGSISGRWPRGPARIRAAIGELGEGSLAIYSSDPAYRDRAGAFESPSARNGWNLTTYKWDPKISRELQTAESPAPENGWRKLVVRAGSKKLTLIVLDWEELPQPAAK